MSAPARGRHLDFAPEAAAIVNELTSTPLLTQQEETKLAQQMQALRMHIQHLLSQIESAPTPEEQEQFHRLLTQAEDELTVVRDRFFAANIRLVLDVIKLRSRAEDEDMFQMGCIGLQRAIDLFDPSKGRRFSTYAMWWIKHALQRECDKTTGLIILPVHVYGQLKKLRRTQAQAMQTAGREITLTEACVLSDMDPVRIQAIAPLAEIPVSLDVDYGEQGSVYHETRRDEYPGEIALHLSIVQECPDILDTIVEYEAVSDVKQDVALALAALESAVDESGQQLYLRHAQVIRLRYRIGERDIYKQRTLEEVGKLMISTENSQGITRESARHLHDIGIRWMCQNCTFRSRM